MPTTREHKELSTRRWKVLRKEILIRDGYICWICGGDGADTADHLIARKNGGAPFDRDNLAAAHKSCNSRKGARNAVFSAGKATPPAFVNSSLPDTRTTMPQSPFLKPSKAD